jgi:peptidyl-prolyl cis-trans isomerase C
MVGLQKGQTTSSPVRTQFGYHVIRLDDVRPVQVPPYEKVEQRIRQQLTQRKVAERVNALREKAKIQ